MEIERRAENRATSTRKRTGMKARDIYKAYPREKANSLIKKLKDKGLWYYDPDFDKDEEDLMGFLFPNMTSTSLTHHI